MCFRTENDFVRRNGHLKNSEDGFEGVQELMEEGHEAARNWKLELEFHSVTSINVVLSRPISKEHRISYFVSCSSAG